VTVRTYATPAAYKTALEARVAAEAKRRGLPINRVRQLFVTERLLVRIMAHFGERVVAKGGLVLELRLNRARTTKDLDLRLTGDAKELLAQVRAACAIATGDLLEYTVEPDDDHPTIEGDGIVYEGFRFVARAMLAGRPYGGAFGVDIGVGARASGRMDRALRGHGARRRPALDHTRAGVRRGACPRRSGTCWRHRAVGSSCWQVVLTPDLSGWSTCRTLGVETVAAGRPRAACCERPGCLRGS